MKKYLIILLIMFFGASTHAENFEALNDTAVNYYLNNDYEKALEIYDSIYKQNYVSPELLYNTGNCYYKLGKLANAIYFYEKALVLAPNDSEIKHNIAIANLSIKDKVEQLPEVFYLTLFNNTVSLISSDAWAIVSISLFIATLGLICLFLFSKKTGLRKLGFTLGIIFITCSSLSFVFANKSANKITNSNSAIIFETSMVKSSPSYDSQNLFEISEGLKVNIKNSINSWVNVRLTDGKEGWIPAQNLKEI
jgi:tetratricopeptide (TPR) repeat protein